MEPRFTRGEYWLLESVVEAGVPLPWLVLDDVGLALNKQGHGLPPERVVESLESLFARGLIEALRRGQPEQGFIPDDAQLADALQEKRREEWTYYALTPAGGEQWETFAASDWNQYISADSGPDGRGRETGRVESASRSRAFAYVSGLHYMGVEVDPASVRHGELSPWEAT